MYVDCYFMFSISLLGGIPVRYFFFNSYLFSSHIQVAFDTPPSDKIDTRFTLTNTNTNSNINTTNNTNSTTSSNGNGSGNTSPDKPTPQHVGTHPNNNLNNKKRDWMLHAHHEVGVFVLFV
jgi:hypothetical protein